jgi:C-terminal domain of tail specific protease (DUF3340)
MRLTDGINDGIDCPLTEAALHGGGEGFNQDARLSAARQGPFQPANPKPTFGDLKLTIAQFFRANGGTTQLHGVMPDILVPAVGDDSPFGKSSFGNAPPSTRISAVDHQPVGDLKPHLPLLRSWHESRVHRDRDYQYLVDDLAKARAQRKNNVISLNEGVRRKKRAGQEKRLVALLGGAAASAASARSAPWRTTAWCCGHPAWLVAGCAFNSRRLCAAQYFYLAQPTRCRHPMGRIGRCEADSCGAEQRIAVPTQSQAFALEFGLGTLVHGASFMAAPPRLNSRGVQPTRVRN